MKLELTKQDVQISGNFPVSNFQIGDISFIVDMFADKVYTDKELAVVREICCNAHDSHVVAGKRDVPFDVHLPTYFEPHFGVRDYGTGLSEHDIRNVFAGIGISTKREDDSVIGCFGIGSLSPYALVDSFTVKSWHGGKCNTYSCYRDNNRVPVVALLTSVDSSEPCGLEVSLSIEGKVSEFRSAAFRVFRFWDNLPNINDGLLASDLHAWKGSIISQGEGYIMTDLADNHAIMGNIGYRIPYTMISRFTGLMLYFDMGEISFDTARENISLDDKTKAAIEKRVKKFESDIKVHFQEKLKSIHSDFEKWHFYINNMSQYSTRFGWKIKDFEVTHIDIAEAVTYVNKWGTKVKKENCLNVESAEYYLKSSNRDCAESRIKFYLIDKPSNKRAVLLDQAAVDKYGIPSHMYKPVTDLPKPERKRRERKVSKQASYAFRSGCGGALKGYWEDIEIDVNNSHIYVEIKSFAPVGIDISDIDDRIKTLRAFGVEVPEVLGLKSTFVNSKAFKIGNFVHFDSYCRAEFEKLSKDGKIYSFNNLVWERIEKIEYIDKYVKNQAIKQFILDKGPLLSKYIYYQAVNACQSLGVQWDSDKPFDQDCISDFAKDFFEKYFMLEMLSLWDIQSNQKIVEKYLNA